LLARGEKEIDAGTGHELGEERKCLTPAALEPTEFTEKIRS
jgi:hypothetical protein